MKEINEHINLLEIEGHSGWKEGKLNNICNCIISGGTPLTSIKEYYNKGTIAWIKTKEVLNNKIYDSEYKISELGLLKSSAKLLPINSIIIAMYGDGDTAGRVAVNKIPLATNQACGNLIINPEIADFQFVFYYLLNSYDELVYLKSGNGQQNLNLKTLKDFDIKVPPLKEQTAIASILSSLDDKIYLLHRQNKTLDQLAETLFRQWFVEEVEESWEEKSLPEIADYLNGLALQKFPAKGNDFLPVIKIREMKQGISENSDKCNRDIPSQYIVQDGDVLFSWSGSLEVVLWTGGEGALNQHLFKVSSKEYPKWFYYLATKHHLAEFKVIAESKSTTMGHIQREHLKQAMISIPSKKYLTNIMK